MDLIGNTPKVDLGSANLPNVLINFEGGVLPVIPITENLRRGQDELPQTVKDIASKKGIHGVVNAYIHIPEVRGLLESHFRLSSLRPDVMTAIRTGEITYDQRPDGATTYLQENTIISVKRGDEIVQTDKVLVECHLRMPKSYRTQSLSKEDKHTGIVMFEKGAFPKYLNFTYPERSFFRIKESSLTCGNQVFGDAISSGFGGSIPEVQGIYRGVALCSVQRKCSVAGNRTDVQRKVDELTAGARQDFFNRQRARLEIRVMGIRIYCKSDDPPNMGGLRAEGKSVAEKIVSEHTFAALSSFLATGVVPAEEGKMAPSKPVVKKAPAPAPRK